MHHMRQDKNISWKQTPSPNQPANRKEFQLQEANRCVTNVCYLSISPGRHWERDALWTVGRSNGTCLLPTDLTPRRTLRNRRAGPLSLVVLILEREPEPRSSPLSHFMLPCCLLQRTDSRDHSALPLPGTLAGSPFLKRILCLLPSDGKGINSEIALLQRKDYKIFFQIILRTSDSKLSFFFVPPCLTIPSSRKNICCLVIAFLENLLFLFLFGRQYILFI